MDRGSILSMIDDPKMSDIHRMKTSLGNRVPFY